MTNKVIKTGFFGALIPKSVQITFINKVATYINKHNQEELKDFEGKTLLFDVTGLNKFYLAVKNKKMALSDDNKADVNIIASFFTLRAIYDGSVSVDSALSDRILELKGSKELVKQLKFIFDNFVRE